MENENFYVHLSSNVIPTSPTEISNKIGNFVTRLNRRLNFSEDWEVALTDISYTKSWYNIMQDEKIGLIDNMNNREEFDVELSAGNYVNIDELVEIINDILSASVKTITSSCYPPKLFYNNQSNKIKIRLGYKNNKYTYPRFSLYLAQFLGLTDSQNRQYPIPSDTEYTNINGTSTENNAVISDQEMVTSAFPSSGSSNKNKNKTHQETDTVIGTLIERPSETRSKRQVDDAQGHDEPLMSNIDDSSLTNDTVDQLILNVEENPEVIKTTDGATDENYLYVNSFNEVSIHGSIHSLYVYCNIIKPIFVGNTEAPLIRRVNIPSDKKFGDICEINYNQPQYYPLVWHEFDSIEIDIKDDSDQTIDFAFGRTAVTLHFRKKAHNVFESLYQLLR